MKAGLPIFDATRAIITLNSAGQPVNHSVNVVTITTADEFPNDGSSQPIEMPQTATPTQVDTIITFVTSQAVRDQAPTTTPKFSLTSGRVD